MCELAALGYRLIVCVATISDMCKIKLYDSELKQKLLFLVLLV